MELSPMMTCFSLVLWIFALLGVLHYGKLALERFAPVKPRRQPALPLAPDEDGRLEVI